MSREITHQPAKSCAICSALAEEKLRITPGANQVRQVSLIFPRGRELALLRCRGQEDRYAGAAVRPAFDPDLPLVRLDNGLGDGQPQ